ncbi:MAG: serine/threonine-protein kinase/endoribonuclease IRE1 family protein [archaeon]|nr:serine/threonine-protein kinase/endoribonuclease IRE1 family protein [archaeon]
MLGYGSHGTIVYKGVHHGREVAVKRILSSFYDVAEHEVALLLAADEHPNVVRYYAQEQDDQFVYLAISLCKQSLEQFVAGGVYEPLSPAMMELYRELVGGVAHLHQLNIVHRDLKPQNVLLDFNNRVKLSDMGLAKKLEFDQVSFSSAGGSGSIGWQAPELLVRTESVAGQSLPCVPQAVGGLSSASSSEPSLARSSGRLSLKIDIWALGCLLYFLASKGGHPFGQSFEREGNVRARRAPRLDALKDDPVAHDLISWMLECDPNDRPTTPQILAHPFFWNSYKRLLFLRDASDRLEIERPSHPIVARLESRAPSVFGSDWRSRLPHQLTEDLGKFRKYNFGRIRDLTRVIRNKFNHYRDLPQSLRDELGDLPEGFLSYFQARFPLLFLTLFDIIRRSPLYLEPAFSEYFPANTGGCPPEPATRWVPIRRNR